MSSAIKLHNRQRKIREIEWGCFVQFLSAHSYGRFLDVGFGNGYALEKAEKLGFSPVGIDLEVGVRSDSVPWERMKPSKSSALLVAISEYLPFQNDAFEVVLSSHSLQYFNNREKSLKEMIRVLKPDGLVVVVVPSGTMAFIRMISCFLFTNHLRISRFLRKDRSLRSLLEIIIPGPQGSYASSVVQEFLDFSRKNWTGLLSRYFEITDVILTALYPFPDYPQLFPTITSKAPSQQYSFHL